MLNFLCLYIGIHRRTYVSSGFLCLCFGLSPAPMVFIKLLKVPIALLRKLKVRLIIYLDDILLMAASNEKLEKGTTSSLFNQCEKSVLCPAKFIEFLGIIINSIKLELSLSKEKLQKILIPFQKTLNQKLVYVRKVSHLIGTLSSTNLAVLPAPLQYRYLQKQ